MGWGWVWARVRVGVRGRGCGSSPRRGSAESILQRARASAEEGEEEVKGMKGERSGDRRGGRWAVGGGAAVLECRGRGSRWRLKGRGTACQGEGVESHGNYL